MGKPIREHPMIAEMLLDMETTVAGARALAYQTAVLQDRAMFGGDQAAARDARELTPLVKWYCTEGAVRVCRLALQIHGGEGGVGVQDGGWGCGERPHTSNDDGLTHMHAPLRSSGARER